MKQFIEVNGKNGAYNLYYSFEKTERTNTWHLLIHYNETHKAMYNFSTKKECGDFLNRLKDYFEGKIENLYNAAIC